MNRLIQSKIFAVKKDLQVLQNIYNAQIKYIWKSSSCSVREGHPSKFRSFCHPHCQRCPQAHLESWVIKSLNLVVEVITIPLVWPGTRDSTFQSLNLLFHKMEVMIAPPCKFPAKIKWGHARNTQSIELGTCSVPGRCQLLLLWHNTSDGEKNTKQMLLKK